MNSLKKLCIVFLVAWLIKELHGQSECETVAGRRGLCVKIENCVPFLNILKKPDISAEEIHILKKMQCGFIDDKPALCCPEDLVSLSPTPLSLSSPVPPLRTTPSLSSPVPPLRTTPSPTLLSVTPKSSTSNNQCTTPDQQPGQCINLYSCAHILSRLQEKPVSQETIQFVQNSRCNGPEKHSVCCGPDPTVDLKIGRTPKTECEAPLTAYPPDPESYCCGYDASFGDKIYGATEAAVDQYPWLVLIEYVTSYGATKFYCGGSLISGRYVLTAAHCVVGKVLEAGTPKAIRLGEHNTTHEGPDCVINDCNKGAISIPIEKTIPHPEYKPSSVPRWNDIALIRMRRLAPYNDFIRPICLPKMDISLNDVFPYNLTVAGWGAVSSTERNSAVKLYVDLPYVPRNKCQPTYRNIPLWNGQLCAGGEEGKDSCKGDSGGPLMWETLEKRRTDIIGIVSFGLKRDCGLKDIAAVYTNVYQYLDWIRSNISP